MHDCNTNKILLHRIEEELLVDLQDKTARRGLVSSAKMSGSGFLMQFFNDNKICNAWIPLASFFVVPGGSL